MGAHGRLHLWGDEDRGTHSLNDVEWRPSSHRFASLAGGSVVHHFCCTILLSTGNSRVVTLTRAIETELMNLFRVTAIPSHKEDGDQPQRNSHSIFCLSFTTILDFLIMKCALASAMKHVFEFG